MPFTYIIIVIVVLSITLLTWHVVGEFSEGVAIVSTLGCATILVGGLLPVYNYEGNCSIVDIPVYETPIGFVSSIAGSLYSITEYEYNSSKLENIKIVARKCKCGFGWYSEDDHYIVDITKSPWKELLAENVKK